MMIGFDVGQRAAKPTPASAIVIEPTATRSIVEWTPSLIRAARASADAGNLELAADFCEWALGDDRVSASLATRTNGLVSLPINFEAARGAKRVVKALEANEDWWAAYPAATLAQLLSWGRFLGVGLAHQTWVERGDGINRLIPQINVWHPRNLRRDMQRGVWKVRTANRGEIEITPGDGNWILFTPYGESRPWAYGTWRPVSYWRLLKQYAIEDWGFYSGKNAGGWRVGTFSGQNEKQASKEHRRELANDMFAAQANAAIVPPPGFDVKVVESTANTWETFKAQKDAADIAIAVSNLGQNLSTEVTGPVATGATLHGKVIQVYVVDDNEKLHTCIRDQSLKYWAEFNFGNGSLAPWASYDVTPPEDKKQRADVLKVVSDALNVFSNANAPVDVRALLERFDIPLKDPKDVEQQGQVFKYHLDYGVLTLNEIRERLGLPTRAGGDEPPKPVAAPNGEGDGQKEAADVVRLRSGRLISRASGFIQGQVYTDGVADKARELAVGVLEEDLSAVIEEIEAATSYEDLRRRLLKAFKGMNPRKLSELIEKATVMANFAGRHAINEDT